MSTKEQWIFWDWKEEPAIEHINDALKEVFDGKHAPSIRMVPDTGSDSYGMLVSSTAFTDDEVQAKYEQWEKEQSESGI